MKTILNGILAALLFVSISALAADAAATAKPTGKSDAKAATVVPNSDARSAAGPVKLAALGSQQNRMRECNKSATGKKGAERKAFMKACLSTRKN